MANLGPATIGTSNTESPRGTHQFDQTIGVSLTPAAVVTVQVTEQTFSGLGTGILAGDVITCVNPPATVAGVGISQFRVDTAVNDKFYISWVNPTAGSLTPTAGVYLLTVRRFISSVTTTPGTLSTVPTVITAN